MGNLRDTPSRDDFGSAVVMDTPVGDEMRGPSIGGFDQRKRGLYSLEERLAVLKKRK
ncbi:MAG TPA: hypothetical protein VFW94_23480 [Candidatus Acidoferrales bacterium]|nr:hypothetical protein [Candidatus Acidoferrales bacterium]